MKAISATDIVEIDLNGKYVIQIDAPVSLAELERTQRKLTEWRHNDEPFLIISGSVTLKRIDKDAE